jgi:hypothetical protein
MRSPNELTFLPLERLAQRSLPRLSGHVRRCKPTFAAFGFFWQTSAGKMIEETTHTVYSFTDPQSLKSQWELLGDFIERFLKETNQESVAIEYDGAMYFVSTVALVAA